MAYSPLHRKAASSCLPAVALTLLVLAVAPLEAQEAPRVHGPGYSVPIPAGFYADRSSSEFAKSLWAQGGALLSPDSAAPERINVTVGPANAALADKLSSSSEECRRFAKDAPSKLGVDLDSAGLAETPLGPACQLAVFDRANARAAIVTMMRGDPVAFMITCNHDARDAGVPGWCREVLDGWRTEAPRDGISPLPRYDPKERPTGGDQFVEAAIDEWPQMVSSPPLTYPPLLKQADLEGSVTLAGVVGTDGKIEPQSLRVVESTHPGFEQAAAEMLLATVFRPGKINGQPVRVLIQLPIAFQLKGKRE